MLGLDAKRRRCTAASPAEESSVDDVGSISGTSSTLLIELLWEWELLVCKADPLLLPRCIVRSVAGVVERKASPRIDLFKELVRGLKGIGE